MCGLCWVPRLCSNIHVTAISGACLSRQTLPFLYRTLAGLNAAAPGYEKILIEPHLVHDLKWASASTETPLGVSSSAWKRVDTGYELSVAVGVGATATVVLPKLKLANPRISESGRAINAGAKPAGILDFTDAEDHATLEVGSGIYRFAMADGEMK